MEVQVGRRLRELREARGLSQEALAERAGINAKFYSRLEAQGANTTVATLQRVCAALGVQIAEVFMVPDQPMADDKRVVRDLVSTILKTGDGEKVHRLRRLLEIAFR